MLLALSVNYLSLSIEEDQSWNQCDSKLFHQSQTLVTNGFGMWHCCPRHLGKILLGGVSIVTLQDQNDFRQWDAPGRHCAMGPAAGMQAHQQQGELDTWCAPVSTEVDPNNHPTADDLERRHEAVPR